MDNELPNDDQPTNESYDPRNTVLEVMRLLGNQDGEIEIDNPQAARELEMLVIAAQSWDLVLLDDTKEFFLESIIHYAFRLGQQDDYVPLPDAFQGI